MIDSYKFGEGHTGQGQVVHFTAHPDNFEVARESLEHFRTINIPSAHQVNVEHGGYGRYSRYEIDQIDYGGSRYGYYEILDIKDAPDDRVPVVSHGFMGSGMWEGEFFAEWEDVDSAKRHWDKFGRGTLPVLKDFQSKDKEIEGLLRVVDVGYLTPWFYATGDIELVGDFAFPEHLNQDPVYRFGRNFLVPEPTKYGRSEDVIHTIKTCMGTVVRDVPERQYGLWGRSEIPESVRKYRAVQWHDGSVTEVYPSTRELEIPVPLADEDTWVVEAQQEFSRMLGGGALSFTVEFANGGKFVGKYVAPPDTVKPNPTGDYLMAVTLDNGEVVEGWVNNFSPTEETPTIVSYVEHRMLANGKNPIKIDKIKGRTKKVGKKWPGVFHASTQALLEQQASDDDL